MGVAKTGRHHKGAGEGLVSYVNMQPGTVRVPGGWGTGSFQPVSPRFLIPFPTMAWIALKLGAKWFHLWLVPKVEIKATLDWANRRLRGRADVSFHGKPFYGIGGGEYGINIPDYGPVETKPRNRDQPEAHAPMGGPPGPSLAEVLYVASMVPGPVGVAGRVGLVGSFALPPLTEYFSDKSRWKRLIPFW